MMRESARRGEGDRSEATTVVIVGLGSTGSVGLRIAVGAFLYDAVS